MKRTLDEELILAQAQLMQAQTRLTTAKALQLEADLVDSGTHEATDFERPPYGERLAESEALIQMWREQAYPVEGTPTLDRVVTVTEEYFKRWPAVDHTKYLLPVLYRDSTEDSHGHRRATLDALAVKEPVFKPEDESSEF